MTNSSRGQTRRLVSIPKPYNRNKGPQGNLTALSTLVRGIISRLAERDVGARTDGGLSTVAAVQRLA